MNAIYIGGPTAIIEMVDSGLLQIPHLTPPARCIFMQVVN